MNLTQTYDDQTCDDLSMMMMIIVFKAVRPGLADKSDYRPGSHATYESV